MIHWRKYLSEVNDFNMNNTETPLLFLKPQPPPRISPIDLGPKIWLFLGLLLAFQKEFEFGFPN